MVGRGQGDRLAFESLDGLTWLGLVQIPAVVESGCAAELSAGVVGDVPFFQVEQNTGAGTT